MFLPHLRTSLIILLCATLLACAKSSRNTADVAKGVFGGSAHMAAMSSASSATAYDVEARPNLWQSNSGLESYGQREKVELSDSQLVLIQQLLQQPGSYDFDRRSLCPPHYDVVFVFHTSAHDIRIGLCFTCDQLAIFGGGHMLNKVDGFSPMRPKLLSLAKALFKSDPEIQSLK